MEGKDRVLMEVIRNGVGAPISQYLLLQLH